jgi:hypothetical protein
MPMVYWNNKKCGNCGLVSTEDLEKRTCPVCETDKCPVCYRGNPQSPMCVDCAENVRKARMHNAPV